MKTVFFDVDTQIDFLYPAGALYVAGAEHLVPAIARLNRYAAEHGIPVVSTMDAHLEYDYEFMIWPPHCVAGTAGQAKPAATLLERRVTVPNAASDFSIEGAQQIIVEKRTLDVFSNPNLKELLARLDADRFVVYGVVTEFCIRHATNGLLDMGKRVEVVTDAIKEVNADAAGDFFKVFGERGGVCTTVDEVCR